MDFFTRLAERTQGLTPHVQPILVSRFAQAATTSMLPDALGEEHASAPALPNDATHAPTHRSHENTPMARQPILRDGIATTRVPSRVARADDTANRESGTNSGFADSVETRTSGTNWVTDPPTATLPVSREGLDFLEDQVQPHLASDLRSEAKTNKAAANQPHFPDEKTGLADSTAESTISPVSESPHRGRFHQTTVSSQSNLQQDKEQADAGLLLLPLESTQHSNESARQHTQSPRAEWNTAIERLSNSPEGHSEPTFEDSEVFVRPRVEPTVRRTESASSQSTASFDRSELTSSFKDDARPVIRINIGRVEVRAILPPTRAVERPAPARPKPNLSLDDYLKRGEKGPK